MSITTKSSARIEHVVLNVDLRDYFAGIAMASLRTSLNPEACKLIAESAYRMADAMLDERERE